MEKKELKETIFLPKTDFSIRKKDSSLSDEKINKWWKDNNISKKRDFLLEKKYGRNKKKILHSGPIYANGKIHIGHLLNLILKDVIVRNLYFNNYYYNSFKIGWDTHGLPIESKIENEKKEKLNKENELDYTIGIRELCRNFALKQIEIQKKQIEKLGLLSESEYYDTFSKFYESEQLRIFSKLLKKGMIYKGLRPVHWSWTNQTALAENELEYKEKKDISLYFKIELDDISLSNKKINLLVWTTQPWTIIFNELIAIDKKMNYLLFATAINGKESEEMVIEEDRLSFLCNKKGWKEDIDIRIKRKITGASLIGMKYFCPFTFEEKKSVIISGEEGFVKKDEGTGIVHISPSFGDEDFFLAQKNNLKINENPINKDGKFNEKCLIKELRGKYWFEANNFVIKELEKKEKIFYKEDIIHSYPHDWRDKSPTIFLLTEQWFLKIKETKEKMIEELKKISYFPSWSEERMKITISEQKDWCLSRQRKWGVPIPIIYKKENGIWEGIFDDEIINQIADYVEINGMDDWFNGKIINLLKDYISKTEKFFYLKNKELKLEKDIMDVWFDSGVSNLIIFK